MERKPLKEIQVNSEEPLSDDSSTDSSVQSPEFKLAHRSPRSSLLAIFDPLYTIPTVSSPPFPRIVLEDDSTADSYDTENVDPRENKQPATEDVSAIVGKLINISDSDVISIKDVSLEDATLAIGLSETDNEIISVHSSPAPTDPSITESEAQFLRYERLVESSECEFLSVSGIVALDEAVASIEKAEIRFTPVDSDVYSTSHEDARFVLNNVVDAIVKDEGQVSLEDSYISLTPDDSVGASTTQIYVDRRQYFSTEDLSVESETVIRDGNKSATAVGRTPSRLTGTKHAIATQFLDPENLILLGESIKDIKYKSVTESKDPICFEFDTSVPDRETFPVFTDIKELVQFTDENFIHPLAVNLSRSETTTLDISTSGECLKGMADFHEKQKENDHLIVELRLQLNAAQQMQAQSDLKLRQKDEIIIKSQNDVQRLRSENEQLQYKLEQVAIDSEKIEKVKNLEDTVLLLSASHNKVLNELAEKQNNEHVIKGIADEYERLMCIVTNDYDTLRIDNTTVKRHLANIELAFSDVHQKYERCKVIIDGYKSNEVIILEKLEQCKENNMNLQEKYEALKSHAMTQLERANKDLATMKAAHEQEYVRLNGQIKCQDIKLNSIQQHLDQKEQECTQLSALLNEITGSR